MSNQTTNTTTNQLGRCENCGRVSVLVPSNNPLIPTPHICFDCVRAKLTYTNLNHADFFCRTFNFPFDPDLWIKLADMPTIGDHVFEEYTKLFLQDDSYPNTLYKNGQTEDLWRQTNNEWAKARSFTEILKNLNSIRDSYVTRARLKWGEQYNFEDLIRLDSIYTRTIKANNITTPLQKEAVKTLCKLQIEIDNAIRANDTKALKDYSSAWKTFAEQANLEQMIQDTHTDDITTVAELYDYMEKQGFQFKYYDGADRDEVDRTIKDIQATNRRLILEATGLQATLEDMIRQRQRSIEEQTAAAATSTSEGGMSLEDLLNFNAAEATEPDHEDDETILNEDFAEEDAPFISPTSVVAAPVKEN